MHKLHINNAERQSPVIVAWLRAGRCGWMHAFVLSSVFSDGATCIGVAGSSWPLLHRPWPDNELHLGEMSPGGRRHRCHLYEKYITLQVSVLISLRLTDRNTFGLLHLSVRCMSRKLVFHGFDSCFFWKLLTYLFLIFLTGWWRHN